MEDIKIILMDILNRLDKIEEQLNKMNTIQEEVKKSTLNMDNHIEFINDIYDNVKKPLSYVSNKINNYMDYSSKLRELD